MNRRTFARLAASALAVAPGAARATGGLDVESTPAAQHVMRVLLASRKFSPPSSLDAWHFGWDGRTYRGSADIVDLPGGERGLVNTVPVDAYLYGVLSKEVSPSWAAGAQQAQAIVSRTYALFKVRPEKPYDVVAGESDQVYGGIESETVEGRAAVDATSGKLVTFDGQPAHVAYSACCGGRTADAGDVWNVSYPYLPSILDPHCVGTPGYDWSAGVAVDAVAKAFGPPFRVIGALESVRIDAPAPDERPTAIEFGGSSSSFETTPKEFRSSLGPGVVRSTFVRSVQLGPSAMTLVGTGRGHGVGLCQWGARVFAETGASAADIVAFYFPGTSIGRG
jgi:stage II sporulation protein D